MTRSAFSDQRSEHNDHRLVLSPAVLPEEVRVTVLADRRFGDSQLYRFFTEAIGLANLTRFRRVIAAEAADGEVQPGRKWVGAGGWVPVLRDAQATAARETSQCR